MVLPMPRAMCYLARAASVRGNLGVTRLTFKYDAKAAFTDFLSNPVVPSDN